MEERPAGLGWIAEWHEVHCLTLVEGLSARELLSHLGCGDDEILTVADEEEVEELDWGTEHYWDWGLGHAGVRGDWAFVLETSSFWGSIEERLGPASVGTRAVCCYSVDLQTHVAYWENGELVAEFEIRSARELDRKRGLDPERLSEPMRRVGFFAEPASPDAAPRAEELGLALLQEVTGVEIGMGEIPTGLVGKLPALGLGAEEDGGDGDGDSGEGAFAQPGPSGTWGIALPAGREPSEGIWVTGGRSGGGWGAM